VCGRPGRRFCPWCATGLAARAHPASPAPCPPGLVPVHAGGEYAGALRALVLSHKERSALGLVRPLGRVLADVVTDLGHQSHVLLVPVPSHPSVVRTRGHDPVLRVVRRAAHVLRARGTPTSVRRVLRVHRRPEDQAGLSAERRRTNVAGSFRALPARPGGSRATVLLVDDVVTTGATLREAQRALVAAGWHPDGAITVAATRRQGTTRAQQGPGGPGLPVRAPGG
jgi:predicted amidophosphoribosyltransferase